MRTLEVEMHIYKENVLMEMQGLAGRGPAANFFVVESCSFACQTHCR